MVDDPLGKVSRRKVAVLLDFVQMRGGGGPRPNFLSQSKYAAFI